MINVANERNVLHRVRVDHLFCNAPLTKKLPRFLSRLNEINEGCEKILPVSTPF